VRWSNAEIHRQCGMLAVAMSQILAILESTDHPYIRDNQDLRNNINTAISLNSPLPFFEIIFQS
jgi:hypothetical protein